MKMKSNEEITKYLIYGFTAFAAILLLAFVVSSSNILSPASVTSEESFWTIDEITYQAGMDNYIAFVTVTFNNNKAIYYEDMEEAAVCEIFEFEVCSVDGPYEKQVFSDVNIPYGSSHQFEFTLHKVPYEITSVKVVANGFNEEGIKYVESEELIIELEPNPISDTASDMETESTPGFTIFGTLLILFLISRSR